MNNDRSAGFTLIETMMVITIMAILTSMVIHLSSKQIQKQRLSSAAQTIFQSLQNARHETFKQNQAVYVSFKQTNQDNWCYGLALTADCNCNENPDESTTINPCLIKTVAGNINTSISHKQFPGIKLEKVGFGTKAYTRFNPVRGTASFGSVTLGNANDESLQIRLSLLGRVRICNPNSQRLSKYVPCT